MAWVRADRPGVQPSRGESSASWFLSTSTYGFYPATGYRHPHTWRAWIPIHPRAVPPALPSGGQFAPATHAESDVDLDDYEDAAFSGREFDEAYDGLVCTALWSSVDMETGEPFDAANYTADDVAPETGTQLRDEFDDFVQANNAVIARIRAKHPSCTPSQVGHDFWLTRNRHGAGFWDRGYGEDGDKLSEAAKVYGSFDLYVGDDGLLHGN